MTNQFRRIAKKIYKSGLFMDLKIEPKYIGFKNVHGQLFTFQLEPQQKFKGQGFFTAGYIREWEEIGLTFESEYTTTGKIKKAKHDIFYIQETDNPDFIYRTAKAITLNQI